MRFLNDLSFHEFIGQYTLLYGETNTQKTYLTAKFVEFLVESIKINPKQISILDFAPKLCYFNDLKIGGRIQDFYKQSKKCNYIRIKGEIVPPRLKAKNKNDLYKNLCHNHEITSYLLQEFNDNPTNILLINDISIYLHLGDEKYILNTIYRAKTFFGNSYFGYSIKKDFSKLLTIKERKRVEFLIKNIKNSIKTN